MIKVAWNSLPRKSNICQSFLYLYNSSKLLYFGSHRKMDLSISNVHFLFYLTNLTTHKKLFRSSIHYRLCHVFVMEQKYCIYVQNEVIWLQAHTHRSKEHLCVIEQWWKVVYVVHTRPKEKLSIYIPLPP